MEPNESEAETEHISDELEEAESEDSDEDGQDENLLNLRLEDLQLKKEQSKVRKKRVVWQSANKESSSDDENDIRRQIKEEWRRVHLESMKEGAHTFPVILQDRHPGQYQSFHWEMIKELRKTVMPNGLYSPLSQTLLENVMIGPQLVTLLEWIRDNVPDFPPDGTLQIPAWQAVSRRLYDAAAEGNSTSGMHLGPWWQILTTFCQVRTNPTNSAKPG
ncbi:uncharacterized protein LOC121080560 [Falco naumanni]|uniref:uncharacterized protein LOC121080560 n=1 Tax=Falco naumanni TaxID=148594 RepID=UPI001ADE1EFD|nr:uncharacterized protein LOC121080560 [Falco naumanni]